MSLHPFLAATAGLVVLLSACGAHAQAQGKSSDPARDVGRAAPGEDNSYFNVTAKNRIPAPLLPLNGQCVIWYPEKGWRSTRARCPAIRCRRSSRAAG